MNANTPEARTSAARAKSVGSVKFVLKEENLRVQPKNPRRKAHKQTVLAEQA